MFQVQNLGPRTLCASVVVITSSKFALTRSFFLLDHLLTGLILRRRTSCQLLCFATGVCLQSRTMKAQVLRTKNLLIQQRSVPRNGRFWWQTLLREQQLKNRLRRPRPSGHGGLVCSREQLSTLRIARFVTLAPLSLIESQTLTMCM